MNLGAEMARARWMAPLDDDEFEDDHIEVLLAAARSKRAELAYGRLRALLHEPLVEAEIGAWPPRNGDFGFQGAIYNAALRSFRYDTACRFLDEVGVGISPAVCGKQECASPSSSASWRHGIMTARFRSSKLWLRQRAEGG